VRNGVRAFTTYVDQCVDFHLNVVVGGGEPLMAYPESAVAITEVRSGYDRMKKVAYRFAASDGLDIENLQSAAMSFSSPFAGIDGSVCIGIVERSDIEMRLRRKRKMRGHDRTQTTMRTFVNLGSRLEVL
jgi:hypothetical protein